MDVITIESEAYQKLITQLNRIEGYIERTTGLYADIEDNLELTTKELVRILGVSLSTLYRWRQSGMVRHRFLKNGEVRYPYNALFLAVKHAHLSVPGLGKEEVMKRLNEFKDSLIINGITYNELRND